MRKTWPVLPGTSNTLYKAKVPGPGYRASRHAHLDNMAGVRPSSSNHATGFRPPGPQPLPHATFTAKWMRMSLVVSWVLLSLQGTRG
jgi:hypothetical protein